MVKYIRIRSLLMLFCFAYSQGKAQTITTISRTENPADLHLERGYGTSLSESGIHLENQNSILFQPEQHGYIRKQEQGKVIFVRELEGLRFEYKPEQK